MIIADGLNELWIRHDRQKSRVTIAEIRTAVASTEDLAMIAARFIEQRRGRLTQLLAPQQPQLVLMATPLLMEEGRVDVNDPRIRDLLKAPPSYRQVVCQILSTASAQVRHTINGLRAALADVSRLEINLSGISDPYLISVTMPGARGYELGSGPRGRFG